MSGSRLLSIRWWLPVAFAAIAAVTALAVARVFEAQSASALRERAQDLAAGSAVGAAAKIADTTTPAEARAMAVDQARRRRVALFVFDAQGRLLSAPSSLGVAWSSVDNKQELLENALAGQRFVESLDDGRRITVALPLRSGPGTALVEVASRPDLVAAASIVHGRIWVAAAWATLIGAVTGVLLSLLITVRVRRIGAAATAIAEGEFDDELTSTFPDELGQLAQAVDTMRRRLSASFGQLASERDQLRSLMEQLHEGVIGIRQDLTVVVANRRASVLLGEEVCEGRPLGNPWPAVDLRVLARRLFEPGSEPQTMRVAPSPEHTYTITGVPSEGTGTAVLVLADVTERERRERAEREFVANAAHELRTPLTAIASAVEVLQLGAREEPDERDRFLAVIERQTARLTRLVRAMLTLARAQSRAEPVRLEPVDIGELLADLALDLELSPSALEVDRDVVALAHEDLLRHAIENLVGNARKYAAGQGLTVSARPTQPDLVAVEVHDQGPGMTPAEAERAVERFFRSGDRDAEGFGLGLSIAREVARAVGGRLEIETRPGGGTTARILLQRAAPAREEGREPERGLPAATGPTVATGPAPGSEGR
ncbi:MAG: cell wall metabolism sensor histidine kinase WalK [Gaiella sp.]|nr:cell wall metabolism sensor histidine kinase WalK [Gaiella sp.]